jgi:uncharacterized lipoprotein YddW (UPF0748 family)
VARRGPADGLNAVVLQVRPTADAFWPSPFEPWSKYLTGTQGASPGYDPLAYAVRQAHRRNLELHAWFNPYRVSTDTDVKALSPQHPVRVHPEWRVAYDGKLLYNPGVPAARRYVEKAILHAVRTYDIDAVHFDDYFYPYPSLTGERFPDRETFRTYGGEFPDTAQGLADWRRQNINLFIREMATKIAEIKPWVSFGVSPFGIWRNASTDPQGSQTSGGVQSYDDLYADTRLWVRRGWLDYIAPQIYWNIGYDAADYATLTRWWSRQVKGTGVRLYIGQSVYKIGDSSYGSAWEDPGEMRDHLTFNRRVNAAGGQVDGDIFYSATGVRANELNGMGLTFEEHYRRPALLPVNTFVPGAPPPAPSRLRAVHRRDRVTLTWRGKGSSFAIYRFARPAAATPCARADATHLVAVVRRVEGAPLTWQTTVPRDRAATFVVSGLSRAHREGAPAQVSVLP